MRTANIWTLPMVSAHLAARLLLVQLNPSHPKPQNKTVLGCKGTVNSSSLGDTRSFLISHPRPSFPTFLEPSSSQLHPHRRCLKGLFGSSALHTLSLAASQGWPQDPGYAINQYN